MLRTRQLPSIKFRAETPATVGLPRMDVAAFVGFAQRGPIHTPVPVESIREFEDIFGGLYPLAWDDQTDSWQMACLAPAVHAFFQQGGRRCWVVRVANFETPISSEDELEEMTFSSREKKYTAQFNEFPVVGLLQKAASGEYRSVMAKACSAGSWFDSLRVKAELQFDPLKLLSEITLPASKTNFSLVVLPIRRGKHIQAGDLLQVDCSRNGKINHRAYVAIQATDLNRDDGSVKIDANSQNTYWFHKLSINTGDVWTGNISNLKSSVFVQAKLKLKLDETNEGTTQLIIDNNDTDWQEKIVENDWLQFETTMPDGKVKQIWLLIGQSLSENQLQIASAWVEGIDRGDRSLKVVSIRRLQLSLKVQVGVEHTIVLSDLAFAAPHPRYIGYLPNDDTLFDPGFGKPNRRLNQAVSQLWEEVKHKRFPLFFEEKQEQKNFPVFLPLGLDNPMSWRGSITSTSKPLQRDGLVPESSLPWSTFIANLFLDPKLKFANQRSLLAEANDRLYLQGKSLKGLHSLIPVEEVSLIAVPDAAHRQWVLTKIDTVPPEPESEQQESQDPCAPQEPFSPCDSESEPLTQANKETDTTNSDASNGEKQSKTTETFIWKLSKEMDPNGLLKVQQSLSELAAARGDLVAVLGLPKHYQTSEALQHQQQLEKKLQQSGDYTNSYVALYHPWPIIRAETGELIHLHPAGHVCGAIAARSINRGAWVAPANEILKEVLATLPTIGIEDEWKFYQAGINPIRGGANSFVIWGSYTQSTEPYWEYLNVRRLLILLRRLALREGQTIAFAPHSSALRRRVKQQFEQRLARLFSLGAFAGQDPSEAYQVVIDDTLNTPATIEQGRLIVDLRVAPSRPLMFITVRLIQRESGALVSEEVLVSGS